MNPRSGPALRETSGFLITDFLVGAMGPGYPSEESRLRPATFADVIQFGGGQMAVFADIDSDLHQGGSRHGR